MNSPAAHPFWLAGRPAASARTLGVTDKWSGQPCGAVQLAGPAQIEEAIAAAAAIAPELAAWPAWRRRAVLEHLVQRCRDEEELLIRLLISEGGKIRRDARIEVARLIGTLSIAAEEAVRLQGDVLPLDREERYGGYTAFSSLVAVGVATLITPFNFPLNLVAHKIGPAIAAGCPFILKPAPATPLAALRLGAFLAELDLPRGFFSILPCTNADAAPLISDERIALLSFTGSAAVGWQLKSCCGKKRVTLELGGNAACIVDADADLNEVTPRLLAGAFAQAGQSCVSTQRIYAHSSIYAALRERLAAAITALPAAHPDCESLAVGPLIHEDQARKIEALASGAIAGGASAVTPLRRTGALLQPLLLENVPEHDPINAEEIFGPLATLAPFTDFDELLNLLNSSRYGLQCGLFTRDLRKSLRAWRTLQVGALVVNDVPGFRADAMPYGGVKDSGLGREGLHAAIREFTQERLLVIRE